MRGLAFLATAAFVFVPVVSAQAAIELPDGTVTANRQDSGTGGSQWFGESVTTLTMDAQNLASGAYIEVTGKIGVIRPINLAYPLIDEIR